MHHRIIGIPLELHSRELPREEQVKRVVHDQVRQHGETADPEAGRRSVYFKEAAPFGDGGYGVRVGWAPVHGASAEAK
ncbi:hypothetical protein [Kribbella sp. NPDC050459]|uniref:hypothetical protein n=1 Tax=Kribbella sp. NPDC050459 TaxID=3155785 RepID=UPI0033F86493